MLADKRKNGYAICFNEWILDKEIRNELGLLLIISGLTSKTGICFASNAYFAEMFQITDVSVSRKIKNLESHGYIHIEYIRRGCHVTRRNIRLTKILADYIKPSIKPVKPIKEPVGNSPVNKEPRKQTDGMKLLTEWNTATGGYYNIGRFIKSINVPLKDHGYEKTLLALRAYLKDQAKENYKFVSVERFVITFGRYGNTQKPAEVDPTSD